MADYMIVIGDTPEHVAASANELGANVSAADVKPFDTLGTLYTHYAPAGEVSAQSPGYVWVGPID